MTERKRAEEVAREIAFKLLYPIITLPEYDNAYDEATYDVLDLLLQFSKEESEGKVSVQAFDMVNNGFHNGVKEIDRLEKENQALRGKVIVLREQLAKERT